MFRKEALENRNAKWKGSAVLLPGIQPLLIALLCLATLVVISVFIAEGSYTRRINVVGEITTNPRPIKIYAETQGMIVKSFSSAGHIISVNDPLYEIDVSKNTASGEVSSNRIKEIKAQIVKIDGIISQLKSNKSATIKSLQNQKEQYQDAWKHSSKIIKIAENGIEFMKKNMDNYKKYQAQGLITNDQLTNQTAFYYQQQNNLLSLNTQNESNALQITTLESQIQIQSTDFDNQIYKMELQRYEMNKEIVNAELDKSLIVRALSSGTVDSLSASVGQMVKAGDSLLQLIPGKIENYNLIVWVPNDAVPYMSPGDKVNIRYDAFPAEKFGQFSGEIALISKIPATEQEMQTYQAAPVDSKTAAKPYYKVVINPDSDFVSYRGKQISLENGMKAETTLFLEKRQLWQWMLTPYYDMKNSALGPLNEQ